MLPLHLYSWAFFYCQRAQTRGARGSARFTGRGMQLGPFNVTVYFTLQSACQTNTLICTHPVHCEPRVSRARAGHPGSTDDFRRIRSTSSSSPPFFIHLLPSYIPLSLPPLLYRSTPRLHPTSHAPSFSRSTSASFIFAAAEVGGWVEIVYLPDENHIGSCYETFDNAYPSDRDHPTPILLPRLLRQASTFLSPLDHPPRRWTGPGETMPPCECCPGRMLTNCGQIFPGHPSGHLEKGLSLAVTSADYLLSTSSRPGGGSPFAEILLGGLSMPGSVF